MALLNLPPPDLRRPSPREGAREALLKDLRQVREWIVQAKGDDALTPDQRHRRVRRIRTMALAHMHRLDLRSEEHELPLPCFLVMGAWNVGHPSPTHVASPSRALDALWRALDRMPFREMAYRTHARMLGQGVRPTTTLETARYRKPPRAVRDLAHPEAKVDPKMVEDEKKAQRRHTADLLMFQASVASLYAWSWNELEAMRPRPFRGQMPDAWNAWWVQQHRFKVSSDEAQARAWDWAWWRMAPWGALELQAHEERSPLRSVKPASLIFDAYGPSWLKRIRETVEQPQSRFEKMPARLQEAWRWLYVWRVCSSRCGVDFFRHFVVHGVQWIMRRRWVLHTRLDPEEGTPRRPVIIAWGPHYLVHDWDHAPHRHLVKAVPQVHPVPEAHLYECKTLDHALCCWAMLLHDRYGDFLCNGKSVRFLTQAWYPKIDPDL